MASKSVEVFATVVQEASDHDFEMMPRSGELTVMGSVTVCPEVDVVPSEPKSTESDLEAESLDRLSYVRVVSSLDELNRLLQHYQEMTACRFSICKRSRLFGTTAEKFLSSGGLKSAQLHWTSRQQHSQDGLYTQNLGLPAVPYSGVPFVQVSTMGLECHMGRVPKFKPAKTSGGQEEEMDFEQDDDLGQKRSPLPEGRQRRKFSGKVGCPATIAIRQIALFPDYIVSLVSEKSRDAVHRKMVQKFKDQCESHVDIMDVQMKYYVRMPHVSAHVGHEVTLQPPILKSSDHSRRLLQRIYDFTLDGQFTDMRFHLEYSPEQLKLHSLILAAASPSWKSSIVANDYSLLVECLGLLNVASMQTFTRFIYTGELVADANSDLENLKSAFKMAGLDEGRKLCEERLKSTNSSVTQWDSDFKYATKETVSVGTQTTNVPLAQSILASQASKRRQTIAKNRGGDSSISQSIRALTNVLFPPEPIIKEATIESKLLAGQTPKEILKEFLVSRVEALEEQLKSEAESSAVKKLRPESVSTAIEQESAPRSVRLTLPPSTPQDKAIIMAQNVVHTLQQTGSLPQNISPVFKLIESQPGAEPPTTDVVEAVFSDDPSGFVMDLAVECDESIQVTAAPSEVSIVQLEESS